MLIVAKVREGTTYFTREYQFLCRDIRNLKEKEVFVYPDKSAYLRSKKSYTYTLTSKHKWREEEGMPLPVLASRSLILLGHILQWPGIQCSGFNKKITVGPNQIGSDRGPDCPHSILGKEVKGKV